EFLAAVGLLAAAMSCTAAAQDEEAQRPKRNLFKLWQKTGSVLAIPSLRPGPLAILKKVLLLCAQPMGAGWRVVSFRRSFECRMGGLGATEMALHRVLEHAGSISRALLR